MSYLVHNCCLLWGHVQWGFPPTQLGCAPLPVMYSIIHSSAVLNSARTPRTFSGFWSDWYPLNDSDSPYEADTVISKPTPIFSIWIITEGLLILPLLVCGVLLDFSTWREQPSEASGCIQKSWSQMPIFLDPRQHLAPVGIKSPRLGCCPVPGPFEANITASIPLAITPFFVSHPWGFLLGIIMKTESLLSKASVEFRLFAEYCAASKDTKMGVSWSLSSTSSPCGQRQVCWQRWHSMDGRCHEDHAEDEGGGPWLIQGVQKKHLGWLCKM